jgi:membrane protein DedA with SNARE-associated domain
VPHPIWICAAVPLALRLHHHVRGPSTGYAGLALAALTSWIGLPGPGEAALVTAGVLAAHHKLDLLSVVVAAWFGATVGGTAGWLIGRVAGRRMATAPGPLIRMRLSAVQRGDRLFARYGPIAVFLAPSWAAGVSGMRPAPFLIANAASAAIWAAAIGAGSFALGPVVLDLAGDVGTLGLIAVIVVVIAGALSERARRRRTRR